MSPERDDLTDLNALASATEFTGMLPAIASEEDPDALAAVTDVPCPVIANREGPVYPPLLDAGVHPSGAHNRPKTTQAVRPAKAPGPYHPGSARNP